MSDAKKKIKDWAAAELAKATPGELRFLKWTWAFTGAISLLYWGLLVVAEWAH